MPSHITRFMDKAVSLAKETAVARPAPALQRGDGGYVEWVLLHILAYKEQESGTYRSVVDTLKVLGPILEFLEVDGDDNPQPSTLCKAMDAMMMALLRALLEQTSTLFDLGDVAAINRASFDRIAASRRYARRTDYRFLAVKTTLLKDCKTGAFLDTLTTSRPHYTQIGGQVLTRNRYRLSIITADKGYEWADLRSMLRENNIRPLIKNRIFDSLDNTHNVQMPDDRYHQRSGVETQIRILNKRYGNRVAARTWYKQFRELALKAAVKNIDQAIGGLTLLISRVSIRPIFQLLPNQILNYKP